MNVPMRHGFDHATDPTLLRDHFAEWDRLREESPFFASDVAADWTVWYVLTGAGAREVLGNPELFSSRHVTPITHVEDHRWIPLELDPPEHTKYRHLLNAKFGPKQVAMMEPAIRARAAELIESFAGKDSCEFVADFGQLFPTSIFIELFGLPVDDMATFVDWIHGLDRKHSPGAGAATPRALAQRAIQQYLGEVIAQRRIDPRDDLISYLIGCEVDGRPLTDAEMQEMCFLLYLAGLDTVTGVLGFTFKHLATNPDHRQAIRETPGRLDTFLEECLRYYAVIASQRVVTRDAGLGGCPMKAGDRVVVSISASERDPAEHPDADRFDIDRMPNRHIAFGAGPHRCLGSHLARLELKIALEEWHKRIPDYRVAPDAELTQHVGGVARLHALPLVWD